MRRLVIGLMLATSCDRSERAAEPTIERKEPVAEPAAHGEPAAADAAEASRIGEIATQYKQRAQRDDPATDDPAAGTLGPPTGSSSELPPLPTGPIAEVNGVAIPLSRFRAVYDRKVAKYADRGREIPASADRRYRKSISERLIHEVLVHQEALRLGVDYDPEVLADREAQQRKGIRDWDLHLQRRGETEYSMRQMHVAEARERAIAEKRGELEVSEAEIDAEYDKIKDDWVSPKARYRASHILVAIAKGEDDGETGASEGAMSEADAKRRAQELHALAIAPGADFAALAREHSSGPSARAGGDIGIFTDDRMVQEFSDAVAALAIGEISSPVLTKHGFHVIKLTGKWPPGALPKSALHDQIVDKLRQRKLHAARKELETRLRDAATIVDHVAPTLGPEPPRRGRSADPLAGLDDEETP